jgi:methylglutaconyl-CoA hydratase
MMKFIKIENYQSDSSIQIISLNRPEVKNAFHPEMINEITTFFNSAGGARLVILKGEGSAFCAGADLNWMKSMVDYSFEQNMEDSQKLWAMFESIQKCPAPVVAVSQGANFGGALGLLACADYVFAEEKAQFCFSEVKLGLSPAVISGFISKKIQDAFYRPYMLSAEVFATADAYRIGLVHQVYQDVISIDDVVKKFSTSGTEAMRETKKLLNSLQDIKQATQQQELCTRVISERRLSAEGQQRLAKFLNRTAT